MIAARASKRAGLRPDAAVAYRLLRVRDMIALRCLGSVLVLLLVATPAAAEPPPAPTVTSYRAWTLGADGVSVAAGLGSLALHPGSTRREILEYGSLTGVLVGAPLIHAVRGHGKRAAGSLGLRLGLGAVGGLLGAGVSGCGNSQGPRCDPVLIAGGAAVGLATAIALDAIYLTHERDETPTWSPQLTLARGGAQVGVAAAF